MIFSSIPQFWRRVGFVSLSLAIGCLVGEAVRRHSLNVRGGERQPASPGSQDFEGSAPSVLLPAPGMEARVRVRAVADMGPLDRALWIADRAENASEAELEELLRQAAGHPDLERAIAWRWAETDPLSMFQALTLQEDHRFNGILFDSWTKADPEGALRTVSRQRQSASFRDSAMMLTDSLFRNAPELGIEACESLPVTGFAPNMQGVEEWASRQPRKAAAVAAGLSNNRLGRRIMNAVGEAWAARDPEAALTFGLETDSELAGTLREAAMSVWASSAPDAARAYVEKQTDPDVRRALDKGLVAGLASTDPESALAWAEGHLHSKARADAMGSVIGEMASKDLDRAADLVTTLDPGGALNQGVQALVEQWLWSEQSSRDGLLEWIEGLPDVEARETAVRSVVARMEMEGDGVIAFVEGGYGHLASEGMMERAAHRRVSEDADSAVAWAAALDEDVKAVVLPFVEEALASRAAESSRRHEASASRSR